MAATDTPATTVPPTDTPQAATEAPSAPPATDTPEPLPTAAEVPAAPEGTGVGQTPPQFAMVRSDGTTIESADIIGSSKPVFMMYFATW